MNYADTTYFLGKMYVIRWNFFMLSTAKVSLKLYLKHCFENASLLFENFEQNQ